MERNGETTSFGGQYGGEERGGGGKLRKPTRKPPPSTPYSRPPASEADRSQQRRWLSKLVDPACRLISGGASLFFPAFFSKSPVTNGATTEDHDNQETETEVQDDTNVDDQNCIINHEMPRTTGVVGPSGAADVSESLSHLAGDKQDRGGDLPDESGLSEIELLMKGKKFTSDEVNRLMQIINSRAAELPNVDKEKKCQSTASGGEAKVTAASHEIINTPSDRNQRDCLWKTSTPLPQSVMPDEVGASPIDIAKAYMGSRTLERGNSSKGMILKDERSLFYGAELASKPFIPSPSPKPSACWPGAMLQAERDVLTPQSQTGRYGLHNFPRTPYSRTIFSKSKSKLTHLQGDNDKWMRPPTSLQTPIYGQVNSRSDALEDGHGSVGPIRRSRQRLGTQTPFRGSGSIESSSVGPSKMENSSISQGFLPAFKKNLEPGGTSSGSQFQSVDRKNRTGVPTVHPQSSHIARTILEHIDRNLPTPKDKSEELKLAFARKKPISSSVPSVDSNGQKSKSSLLCLKEFDSHKIVNQDAQNKPVQENSDNGKSLFSVRHQENTVKAVDTVSSSRSDVFLGNGGHGVSHVRSSHEEVTRIGSSQALNLQKRPAASGTKPLLSNISIDKPNSKWTLSSDQSSGFTFPVSTAPEVLSEPPTPSITPSFSASSQHQPNDGSGVPSYTFGSTKSSSSLVFSFPSTSSAAIQNDTSDIKFSFGSEKPRLSFNSVKKDAICY